MKQKRELPTWTYGVGEVTFPFKKFVPYSRCPWCDEVQLGIFNCKWCPNCHIAVGMNKHMPYAKGIQDFSFARGRYNQFYGGAWS